MSTNHRIDLPADLLAGISQAVSIVDIAHIPYDNFVEGLMKGMATPADELLHATVGMSGEAGELLDAAKKVWVYNKPLDVTNVVEELGDLRFYYQALLNMLNLTDEQVRAYNVRKLLKRYPGGVYTDAAAQARADKQHEQQSATSKVLQDCARAERVQIAEDKARMVDQNERKFFGKVSDKENVLPAADFDRATAQQAAALQAVAVATKSVGFHGSEHNGS